MRGLRRLMRGRAERAPLLLCGVIVSQLRSFSYCIVILIPVLRAPTARLRGPIIVSAAPQLICRYAADWGVGLTGHVFCVWELVLGGRAERAPLLL